MSPREPWVQDADLDLYVGDVREVLAGLSDESVDCGVTSPPYWGLRDYGTGLWDGGDTDCDHKAPPTRYSPTSTLKNDGRPNPGAKNYELQTPTPFRDVCGRCGARRVDQQLGLEPTPQEYVANMVDVFRQVRRVLRPHGTLWLNLGDSYANNGAGNTRGDGAGGGKQRGETIFGDAIGGRTLPPGLKPKDLCGIPWRVAFALQDDGWYLRADIVWSKPNPMPESVTDRPTKAHEYVFLLSKQPRYWFDSEAVREPNASPEQLAHNQRYAREYPVQVVEAGQNNSRGIHARGQTPGRNIRSVWEIATQPYSEAHFATFPEELPRRCVLAGCPEWVCGTCGKARERLTEREPSDWAQRKANGEPMRHGLASAAAAGAGGFAGRVAETVGWSDCGHNAYQPGVVLDPFFGSGTTGLVARNHGRRTIGIELNPEYARLAARRLQQLSLFAEAGGA